MAHSRNHDAFETRFLKIATSIQRRCYRRTAHCAHTQPIALIDCASSRSLFARTRVRGYSRTWFSVSRDVSRRLAFSHHRYRRQSRIRHFLRPPSSLLSVLRFPPAVGANPRLFLACFDHLASFRSDLTIVTVIGRHLHLRASVLMILSVIRRVILCCSRSNKTLGR